jgi:hydroxymethylglutaryl-CoA synthase
LTDKNAEKTFVTLAKNAFASTVEPSMHCARRCGNMYTASLYGGLASLVSAIAPADLKGKRISLFAYGSGCASSFFAIRVKGDTTEIRRKLDLLNRLAAMTVVPCQDYVDALHLREKNHNAGNFTPVGSVEHLWPGSYYLESVDNRYRRKYARVPAV